MFLNNKISLMSFFRICLITSLLLILNACSKGDPTKLYQSLIIEFNDIQSISVSAINSVIATNGNVQLNVTGTNSLAETFDLTDQVSWSLSDKSLATISSGGLLTALSVDGTVTVTASLSTLTDTIDITVSSAALLSIKIKANTSTPDSLVSSVCRPLNLKALGAYDDGSERDISALVSWTSSTSAIIKTKPAVSISHYQAIGVDVMASLDGIDSIAASVMLNDDISSMIISPLNSTLLINETVDFQAKAVYGSETNVNISSTVNWTSSDTDVAAFDKNAGQLTGKANGETTVSAECGSQTKTTLATVESDLTSITIEPDTIVLSLYVGSSFSLTATGHYVDGTTADITQEVNWSVSNSGNDGTNVSINNQAPNKGQLTASLVGADKVTAELSGVTAEITVFVQ